MNVVAWRSGKENNITNMRQLCVGGNMRLPHITQTAHSIFSDILVRVVEI